MKTGKNGVELIKSFEGLHDGDLTQIGLQPKKDPIGIWTEGWGHAMRDKKGNFLRGSKMPTGTIKTIQEADNLLIEDLKVYELIVLRKVTRKLTQNQFDALVSHTYNTGGSSTLFRLVNNNAPNSEIKNWFETKYITGGGKKLNGLIRRRKAESDLYFSKL